MLIGKYKYAIEYIGPSLSNQLIIHLN